MVLRRQRSIAKSLVCTETSNIVFRAKYLREAHRDEVIAGLVMDDVATLAKFAMAY